ncbi:MAG: quinoprotein relay system zinc metallohydrolase 2 [Albidovulum sp.]|uniref:quinoprotein relay system zinc metallohydrolase 2 n=1 Tax=Albidovulum sp. TaxID=1872424 RepID=UPI003CA8CDC2
MFEAVVMLCLEGAAGQCRAALRPGYAAETLTACEEALTANPPVPFAGQAGMAECRERPAPALTFVKIAPHTFVHRGRIAEPDADNLGDVSNIAFVIGDDGVAVIDAGGSRAVGEAAYLAIREQTELPIKALILTHMHPDHVLGASVFQEAGAEIIGRERLSRALAERSESYLQGFGERIGGAGFLGTVMTLPDREVSTTETLDLGGRILTLTPHTTAHTTTDLSVHDPVSGVLFAGDLVFDDHAPALDGSLRGWTRVLADLGQGSVTRVVPGHGGPVLPWPDGALPLMRYLETIAADTRKALDDGLPLSSATAVIGRSEAMNWQLFDLFNARNATVAYTELEWE